jgi:pyruvate/2-oxoglutarate dehydrogenase complex dihydrolipoamide acyltransferase (E2) component
MAAELAVAHAAAAAAAEAQGDEAAAAQAAAAAARAAETATAAAAAAEGSSMQSEDVTQQQQQQQQQDEQQQQLGGSRQLRERIVVAAPSAAAIAAGAVAVNPSGTGGRPVGCQCWYSREVVVRKPGEAPHDLLKRINYGHLPYVGAGQVRVPTYCLSGRQKRMRSICNRSKGASHSYRTVPFNVSALFMLRELH